MRKLITPGQTKPVAKSCRAIGRRGAMRAFDDEGGRRVAEGCRTEGACDRVCSQVVYLPENHAPSFQYAELSISLLTPRVCCEGRGSPFWGKGKGVFSPYHCAFRNLRCGYQPFSFHLVEVFNTECGTFLRVLERIEAVEKFTGG